jgi:hypothetical protein
MRSLARSSRRACAPGRPAAAWRRRPRWTRRRWRSIRAPAGALGRYVPLVFRVGAALAGWALLRIHEGPAGTDAALLDLRAREPSEAIYTWMASEAAVHAAGFGPGLLVAGTTCPEVAAALRANRFRAIGTAPVHYWAKDGAPLEAPVAFGLHWGDETILPYPTERWNDAKRRAQ